MENARFWISNECERGKVGVYGHVSMNFFFFDMNIKSESLGQEDVDPIASNKGKSAIVAEVEMPMVGG